MNTKLENKLTMWMVLRTFLQKSTATTDALPGFAALFVLFHGTIEQVKVIRNALGMVTKEPTENKRQFKELLSLKAAEMAGMIRAFAIIAEDSGLAQQMKISISSLKALKDPELIVKAQAIYDKGSDKENDYTSFGITLQKLDDLHSFILRYTLMMIQPRTSIDDHKHTNEELSAEVDAGDAIVVKMDALVEIIRYTNELFYSDYWTRHKIISTGHRTRSLQLWVLDDASGEGIPKAKVTLTYKSGADLQKIVKSTGKKGGITGKNMESGEYQYEIVFGGKRIETGSFFINDGLMTEVTVRMKKG